MQVFVVMVVSRQIDGEYIFTKAEKAFDKASKADAFMNELKTKYIANGKYVPTPITTPDGSTTMCMCEVAGFALEVE